MPGTHRLDCDVLRNVDIDNSVALANRPSDIVLDNISLLVLVSMVYTFHRFKLLTSQQLCASSLFVTG